MFLCGTLGQHTEKPTTTGATGDPIVKKYGYRQKSNGTPDKWNYLLLAVRYKPVVFIRLKTVYTSATS